MRYADEDRADGRNTMTRDADEDFCTPGATKPASPMLRDEATDWLLARLEDESSGVLRVEVENGLYRAKFVSGVTTFEGDWLPNLTDALCSLIGGMP